MKRKVKALVAWVLAALLCFSLAACGNSGNQSGATSNVTSDSDQNSAVSDEEQPAETDEAQGGEEENINDIASLGDVDVDKGLFSVTLTIPADFVDEGTTQEDLDRQAEENGYKSITLNDDGSTTWVITKAQHEELLAAIAASIDESLDDMLTSGDYPNMVSIVANDDYTEFNVVTKSTELDIAESFSVIAFYMYGGMYHVFSGDEAENICVKFVNEATGEVIEEANSSGIGE